MIVIVLLAGVNEFLDFQHETALLRQTLETSETLQTLAILHTIEAPVLAGDWAAVHTEIRRLESVLPENQLLTINTDGAILADSKQTWPRYPADLDEFSPTPVQGLHTAWLGQNNVLWITVPIVNQDGRVKAYLINESYQQGQFLALYQNKAGHTAQFLVAIFLLLGLFFLINWSLFITPLRQIYRLSRAITQGSSQERAPDSPVFELQQINMAYNNMVDHLASQRASLETLNHKLEDTVSERTVALEASNADIRNRANQLGEINALIASTEAAVDMPTLLQTALEQSMRIMQVEMGSLWIHDNATNSGLPIKVSQLIEQAADADQTILSKKVIVDDWDALSGGHSLVSIAATIQQFGIRSSLTLPIYANNEPAGLLCLASQQPRHWTPDEIALIEIITHHLSTATERTLSVDHLRMHNAWMRQLVTQSEQMNRTFTVNEVIETIGRGALALSQADRLGVFIMSANHDAVCAWSRGISPEYIQTVLQLNRQGLWTNLLSEPTILLTPDCCSSDLNLTYQQLAKKEGYRATSVWPLVYENQPIAIVTCLYNEPRQWEQDHIEILEAFFRQAAAALENARLFEAECAQRRLAEALRDVTATLTSTLDLEEVLEGILSNLGRVVPHDAATIMLLEGDMVRLVRWHGLPEMGSDHLSNWQYSVHDLRNRKKMVETAQAVVIPDTSLDPNWVSTTGFEWVRSYAGAPICQRGVVIGFIDAMSSQPEFFYSDTGLILQTFANQAAIALENARLYHSTQERMAETISLYRAVQPLFNPVENISDLAQHISESVIEEFASAHCSILLVNEARTHLVLIAQSGFLQVSAPELPLNGSGLTVAAVRTGKIIYSPDVNRDPGYVYGAAQTRSELVIPLRSGDHQVIGVLNLESPEIDAFDERGRRLLASYADQVALGLENARLFATIRENATQMAQLNELAQRRAQEAETLRLATAALSSTLDLQTVLESILNHLEQVLPYASACIFLVDGDQYVRARAAKNLANMDAVLHKRFPRLEELPQEIEKGRRTVTLPDAQADPRFHDWGGTSYVHGWMGVALVMENEYLGFLTLDRRECNAFKPEEMALAQAFASQAAIAVQNARLYEAAQQSARELEALHTATTSLVSTLDLQKLLERILVAATSAIPSARAAVLQLFDITGRGSLRVLYGLDEMEAQSTEWNAKSSLWARVLEDRRPLLISGASRFPEDAARAALPVTWQSASLLIAPLIQEDESLGVITLISNGPDDFTEQDLHLLISFASTATAAIHNAQLHSAVQYLAITDPLTAIYNRRGFFDRAQHLLDQAQDADRPLSAIMIDIDFFKNINDRYGHDAGDAVLRALAERCRSVLRETDIICRYGGEEFALLLPESDLNGAWAAANRLFHSITATPIITAAGPVRITISVGVATYSAGCSNLDHLLKRADIALYLAKENGRNQVRVWER